MTRAADPLAPLVDLLALLGEGGQAAGVHPGLRIGSPLPDGWLPALALADAEGPELSAAIKRTAERWEASWHAAAGMLWKAYAYWAALPVALGWALNRRVPLAGVDGVAVRFQDGPPYLAVALQRATVAVLPGDPAAASPGVTTAADARDLLARLRASLIDGHLAPIAEALHRATRVGRRPLWGSVAEALAWPLIAFAPALPGDPVAEARALLAGMGPGIGQLVEIVPAAAGQERPAIRRRTCCLAFTAPGLGFCASCCLAGSAPGRASPGRGGGARRALRGRPRG